MVAVVVGTRNSDAVDRRRGGGSLGTRTTPHFETVVDGLSYCTKSKEAFYQHYPSYCLFSAGHVEGE
jgi:hypothetical protein